MPDESKYKIRLDPEDAPILTTTEIDDKGVTKEKISHFMRDGSYSYSEKIAGDAKPTKFIMMNSDGKITRAVDFSADFKSGTSYNSSPADPTSIVNIKINIDGLSGNYFVDLDQDGKVQKIMTSIAAPNNTATQFTIDKDSETGKAISEMAVKARDAAIMDGGKFFNEQTDLIAGLDIAKKENFEKASKPAINVQATTQELPNGKMHGPIP